MAVYAKCMDSSGRTRYKFSEVPPSKESEGKYLEFSLNGEHPRISDIVIYSMRYPEPNGLIYRIIIDALDNDNHEYKLDELRHVLNMLFQYVVKDDTWVKDNQQAMLNVAYQLVK